MIKNIVLLFAAFFVVFAISADCAYSQDDTGAAVKTIGGRVISVDPQGFSMTVKTYENTVFSVPLSAKLINKDGFDVELSDINPGNYVTVDYYDTPAGAHIARHVELDYNR